MFFFGTQCRAQRQTDRPETCWSLFAANRTIVRDGPIDRRTDKNHRTTDKTTDRRTFVASKNSTRPPVVTTGTDKQDFRPSVPQFIAVPVLYCDMVAQKNNVNWIASLSTPAGRQRDDPDRATGCDLSWWPRLPRRSCSNDMRRKCICPYI